MVGPTRRKIKREVEKLREGEGDPDALESWKRFLAGDLDENDRRHRQWLAADADRDVPDSEVIEYIRKVERGEIDPFEDVDADVDSLEGEE